jgi:hypothetical protein
MEQLPAHGRLGKAHGGRQMGGEVLRLHEAPAPPQHPLGA